MELIYLEVNTHKRVDRRQVTWLVLNSGRPRTNVASGRVEGLNLKRPVYNIYTLNYEYIRYISIVLLISF